MTTCPDCTGRHDPTCPLVRGIDVVRDADRQFFVDHPGTDVYFRPVHQWELADLRATGGVILEMPSRVRVVQIEPGVRARVFGRVMGMAA